MDGMEGLMLKPGAMATCFRPGLQLKTGLEWPLIAGFRTMAGWWVSLEGFKRSSQWRRVPWVFNGGIFSPIHGSGWFDMVRMWVHKPVWWIRKMGLSSHDFEVDMPSIFWGTQGFKVVGASSVWGLSQSPWQIGCSLGAMFLVANFCDQTADGTPSDGFSNGIHPRCYNSICPDWDIWQLASKSDAEPMKRCHRPNKDNKFNASDKSKYHLHIM